jgi:hypothetical protein
MESCSLSSYLKFILDIQAYDNLIRHRFDKENEQQNIALTLFHRYLSIDAPYLVPITDDIRRTTLGKHCSSTSPSQTHLHTTNIVVCFIQHWFVHRMIRTYLILHVFVWHANISGIWLNTSKEHYYAMWSHFTNKSISEPIQLIFLVPIMSIINWKCSPMNNCNYMIYSIMIVHCSSSWKYDIDDDMWFKQHMTCVSILVCYQREYSRSSSFLASRRTFLSKYKQSIDRQSNINWECSCYLRSVLINLWISFDMISCLISSRYISLQASTRLGFDDAIRARIECSICQPDVDAGPSADTFDQTAWIVYVILQRVC